MHGLSMCFKIVLIHEITSFCMKTKWFSVVQCFKGDKIIQSIPFVPFFEGQIKKIGEINPYGTCLLLYSYAIAFIKIFELLCRRTAKIDVLCAWTDNGMMCIYIWDCVKNYFIYRT